MNRLIYTILLFFLSNHSIKSQTTYYYGLTKKIIDGKVSMSVSGGQFISFLNEICYESNKNSIGVGHGTLKLNKSYSDSRFKFYMGNSYWGDAATFKFKSDLSVLNVVLENGDGYVYKRQTAPSSVTTCSPSVGKRSRSSMIIPPIESKSSELNEVPIASFISSSFILASTRNSCSPIS